MAKRRQFSLNTIPTSALASELQNRRESLVAELAIINEVLGVSGGAGGSARSFGRMASGSAASARRAGGRRGRSGPRGSNTLTLVQAMSSILSSGAKPVTEILEAIPSTGYKSKSKNLRTMVSIQLAQRKDIFRRVKRGVYAVK